MARGSENNLRQSIFLFARIQMMDFCNLQSSVKMLYYIHILHTHSQDSPPNYYHNFYGIALIECLALDADIIATRVRHHSPELVFIYIC